MTSALIWIGRLSGLAGALLCAVALGYRLTDAYFLGGIPVGTLFNTGVGAMVLGCLAYVSAIAERRAT
jgi:hypothetical protein